MTIWAPRLKRLHLGAAYNIKKVTILEDHALRVDLPSGLAASSFSVNLVNSCASHCLVQTLEQHPRVAHVAGPEEEEEEEEEEEPSEAGSDYHSDGGFSRRTDQQTAVPDSDDLLRELGEETSPELLQLLDSMGMKAFAEPLGKLFGVTKADDVPFVRDAELSSIGMGVVQIRRIRKSTGAVDTGSLIFVQHAAPLTATPR